MTPEHQAMLQLLRKALNPSAALEILSDVNWKRFIRLAHEQGVLGVCFSAVEQTPSGSPLMGSGPGFEELMDWIGRVEQIKANNKHQLSVAKELAAEFKKNGIRTKVLKGAAYARYYPTPEYRLSCDFDCYLTDFEQGNKIAEQLGASVDRSEQKHSHIIYKGIHIENHRECTGVSKLDFEQYLESMLLQDGKEDIEESDIELPPLMFDALFCLYHAQTHFIVEEGIQLRHVVDWLVIRKKLKDALIYDQCMSDCRKYDLLKFAEALSGIADLIEGRKEFSHMNKAEKMLWNDILFPKRVEPIGYGKIHVRLNILRQIWQNRWKYQLYTNQSASAEIFRYLARYAKRQISRTTY